MFVSPLRSSETLAQSSGSKTATYNYDLYGSMLPSSGNTYAYDGVPNLRCINCSDPLNKIEYTYDGINQRIAVTRGSVKTYEVYDPQGNLLVESLRARATNWWNISTLVTSVLLNG